MYLSHLIGLLGCVLLFVISGLIVVNGMIHDKEKATKAGFIGVVISLLLLLGSYYFIFEH